MRGEDAVQSQVFKSVAQDFPPSLRCVSVPPVGNTEPIAKFGVLMIWCKPQADSSAQKTAIAQSDGEPHLVVAASGEEVACFRLGVRVRNAQRGSSDVTRSDERHQLRDVVFGEWTQFQPL